MSGSGGKGAMLGNINKGLNLFGTHSRLSLFFERQLIQR